MYRIKCEQICYSSYIICILNLKFLEGTGHYSQLGVWGRCFRRGWGALFFSGTSLGVPQKSSMMRFEAKFVESAAGILGVTKTPSAAVAARMEISLRNGGKYKYVNVVFLQLTNLYYNTLRSCVCVRICLFVHKLLAEQWLDLLHIW